MSNTYFQDKDPIGLNVTNVMMGQLNGEQNASIQKKTAKQNKLAQAASDGSYPSLGANRGDLPFNAGVILIDELDDGPAAKAGLETVDDGGWDDSNVIVAINNYPVQSAVIGTNSMDNAFKQIELGSTAKVTMKDGSTHEVKLDLAHNRVDTSRMEDFQNPKGSTDTDIDFGAHGYAIGMRTHTRQIGMMITSISSDSSLSDSDLEPGDVICRIDNYTVGDEDSIDKITKDYFSGDSVTVDYVTKTGHLKSEDVTLVGDDD